MRPCDKYTYYYDNTIDTLNVGNSFHIDPNSQSNDAPDGYYSDGVYVFTVVSGVITERVTVGDCGIPDPPPPIQYYEHDLGFGANKNTSCSHGSDPLELITFYSNASDSDLIGPTGIVNFLDPSLIPSMGYGFYTDTDLTLGVNNGYYSDGTYWFYVSGSVDTNNKGLIRNAGSCI